MPKEEWKDGKQEKVEGEETVNQASALWTRGEERHQRRAVQGVLQARRPRLRRSAGLEPRARRGPAGVHAPAVPPVAGAVRPVGPQRPPRHQALRAPRLHHGRRRAAAAGVPALRPRRRRFERSAAQHLARDPAGVEGHRGDPRRLHAQGARPARGAGGERQGEVRAILGRLRHRAEGRHRRGLRQQGPHRRPAALRLDPRRYGRPDRVARRVRRPHEGRAGQDLLRDGRDVQRREEQPAPRGVPQEGHRSAAALRPRRRVGRGSRHRIRRQGAGLRRQGRSRSRSARGRSREEGTGAGGHRALRSRRPHQGEPRRARQGGPRDASADGIAGLPRRRTCTT